MFRCDSYSCNLSEEACGTRYRRARDGWARELHNRARSADRVRDVVGTFSKCRDCRVGMENAALHPQVVQEGRGGGRTRLHVWQVNR